VEHDIIAVGDDQRVLVMQLFRRGLDKFEEPLAPRRDKSTVLDIGWRLETLGRGVVPLVEQGPDCFEDGRLISGVVLVMSVSFRVE
jgi:hypothetical protein